MDNDIYPEPKRVLQFYDPEKQKQFAHFTAQDRLDWLAAINELYWAAQKSTQNSQNPQNVGR